MAKWILAVFVLLVGCQHDETQAPPGTHPRITKLGIYQADGGEATPVVFNDKLLLVSSVRTARPETFSIRISEMMTNTTVAEFPTEGCCISAVVHGGELYIFMSMGLDSSARMPPGNRVEMIKSADLITWSDPITVIQAPSYQAIYNTSVTETPDGFVMSYDVSETGLRDYSERFMYSANLLSWSPIGSVFSPDQYTSAATIRYLDGYYYLFHLRHMNPYFVNFVARSTDLQNWEKQRSQHAPMSPIGTPAEGICTSDLDMIEYQGKTYMVYLTGDQLTWGTQNAAVFDGALAEYLALFF